MFFNELDTFDKSTREFQEMVDSLPTDKTERALGRIRILENMNKEIRASVKQSDVVLSIGIIALLLVASFIIYSLLCQ